MYFRSQKKNAGDKSINDVIDTDKEGNELTLVDIIVGEDNIAENLEKKINIEKMMALLRELDEREQKVLLLRYGLDNKPPRSQQETADRLGISRSYISRIEKKAIEKLRQGFDS
jgi:RNA polymerase sporulation-specific sigma factor